MIRLAKEYPCVLGAPVIRGVDPGIFTYRYFTFCMSCTFCGDACCSYGVDIDVQNIERLSALGSDFEAYVGAPREQWFSRKRSKDHEFPGGANGRTKTKNGACVFLDRKNRGCKIHAYCLAKGMDYHQLKPLVSVLFPLTFEDGTLVPASEVTENELICSGEGPSLYDGVREELIYYFGGGFVEEVDLIRSRLSA
jgi:hypothetical protein